MTSHAYNTRHNSLASNENSNPQTSKLIINLKSKLLSPFDNLNQGKLNLKYVIIKDLQVENQRRRSKINNHSNRKVISLKEKSNSLEQYGRKNKPEITGSEDNAEDHNLEEKVN